ncbi:hypothetical protein ACFL3U_00990 [Pseudomonadota bacterium]
MRLVLVGLTVALIYPALKVDSTLEPLWYWSTLVALTALSLLLFKRFFTFFLITALLAYNFADLNSSQTFHSMVLPAYIWLSIIVLLITAILTFPDLLGQKTNPSDPGSSIDGFGCGGDGGCGGD